MKLKKQKVVSGADELGDQYTGLQESISALGKTKDSVRSDIIGIAEAIGTEEGKQTLVYGKKYVVGFVTTEPADEIDYAKLRKVLSPEQWRMILKLVVDSDLLTAAIETGKISRKLISKCLVKSSKTPQQRVYVAKIGEKRNEDQE